MGIVSQNSAERGSPRQLDRFASDVGNAGEASVRVDLRVRRLAHALLQLQTARTLKPSRRTAYSRLVAKGLLWLDAGRDLRWRRHDLLEGGHELVDLGLRTDRDAQMLRHRRERSTDQHVTLLELGRDF